MMRRLTAALAAATVFAVLAQCSGATQFPTLTMRAMPNAIAADGTTSTITVTAVDDKGSPGTGSVHVVSVAGSLAAGTDVTLANGTGTVSFSCNVATEPACDGSIRLTGTWDYMGMTYTGTATVRVGTPFDGGGTGGGSGAGGGAGVGGGTGGATGGGSGTGGGTGTGGGAGGSGGGLSDGGMTPHRLVLSPSKPSLVFGTGDSLTLTAALTLTAGGTPVPGATVDLMTTAGSFAMAPGTTSTSVVTDDAGVATVTFYTAGAPVGNADITGTALTATSNVRIGIVSVANILWQADARTKSALGIQFSNRDLTTPVYFKVVDAAARGVRGVDVTYTVTGVGGANVSPRSITDDGGIGFTTLSSGDALGIATVTAKVTATIGSPSELQATHDIPIVAGKPSGGGFVLGCVKKNLGALHTAGGTFPPTRMNTTTSCTVELRDRFNISVGLATPVQFYAEKGAFAVPMVNTAITGMIGTATNTYNSYSSSLPLDVPPVAGEPTTTGTKNPRDMLVTIIAIANGEEEFYDGPGGTPGRWDPGEWFIDQSEPFIDSNDNNVWDPGETFFNNGTDCAHPDGGGMSPSWDGPNGCWDSDTQLWESTHVVWTGALDSPIQFSPPIGTVNRMSTKMVNYSWGDQYGNNLSVDGPNVTVALIGSGLGSVSILNSGITGDQWGAIDPHHDTLEATETAAGSGVFNVVGPCSSSRPAPTNPLTRCIRRVSFGPFGAGNSGILTFTGRNSSQPDGGPPPSTGTVRMTGAHSFSTSVFQDFPVTFQ